VSSVTPSPYYGEGVPAQILLLSIQADILSLAVTVALGLPIVSINPLALELDI